MCYSQLISVCVLEEENGGAVYSLLTHVTNTASALYNHLHGQHANTKLAKRDDEAE